MRRSKISVARVTRRLTALFGRGIGAGPARLAGNGKTPAINVVEFMESRLLLSAAVHAGAAVTSKIAKTPAHHAAVKTSAPKTTVNATTPAVASQLIALPTGWQAKPYLEAVTVSPNGSSTPPAGGLTPAQIRGAYGLGQVGASSITFNGLQADGAGQTIVIVDAYDDPNALTDLNTFSTQYGLPAVLSGSATASNPGFTKFGVTNAVGLTSTLPPTNSTQNGQSTSSWEGEESLDIEWAHAMAPQASIVLVEASDTGVGLYYGDLYGATIAGAVVVSNSWGGNEFNGETGDDFVYTTPSGHMGGSATATGSHIAGGVTFLYSSGDGGAFARGTATITPQYPAASPNVVSVGGTRLTVGAGNVWSAETVWGSGTSSGSNGGGGGGISTYETEPTYQTGYVPTSYSSTKRTYPDISMLADPGTGVGIVDSWDFGAATPWFGGTFGGTSLACPLTAGLVAVADQGRAVNGLGSLDGVSQTLPRLYKLAANASLNSTDFHDITSGNSGPSSPLNYGAVTGYDLSSGIGAPIANKLLPDLMAVTTTTLVDNGPNPSLTSQLVSFTATVSGLVPNGATITLVDNSNSNATVGSGTLSGGSASINIPGGTLSAGTHLLTAIYPGDANFIGSNSNQISQKAAVVPALASSQAAGGAVQRSSVSSISVTFAAAVNFTSASFSLLKQAQNANGSVNAGGTPTDVSSGITATSSDNITWTLSVTKGGALDRTAATSAAGFFSNGIFQLVLHGAQVTDFATGTQKYNNAADQIVGFNSVEAGGTSNYFHVLFGDLNGDGVVNATDYFTFSRDYLAASGAANYNAAFDYNGDGTINATDYFQFSRNYLVAYSY